MGAKILIMEDETRMRRLLKLILQKPGYQVQTAADGKQGIAIWKEWQPDLVISDLKMPGVDGLEVLNFRNTYFPNTVFIILTAFGTVETAVEAMKNGAFDYLTKPVDNNRLLELVAKALKSYNIPDNCTGHMIGNSSEMQQLRRDIAMVAETDSSVLITGESGTGKELAAQAVHNAYAGQAAPFIRVNCPAIPKDLLESELFGHRRGAFTGAVESRDGAFVAADGGTLFLDEIGDLSADLQPKLLHAVEEKQITPVGGTKTRRINVKIVAATNRNMEDMVNRGDFRQDLFYRLNTLRLHLPPLREHIEDIEDLALYFLERFCKNYGKKILKIERSAIACMKTYSWPGNIRELRNVMESGALKCQGEIFTKELLPTDILRGTRNNNAKVSSNNFDLVSKEKDLIEQALRHCYWNQSQAAKKLGITRNTLRYRMKKYGITKK